MSDTPVTVLVANFASEHGAERALANLKRSKGERLVGIHDAAAITCDGNGQLHLNELGDMRGGKGALVGTVVGGAIGLLFPPSVLAGAAVGAALGGLGAKLHDAGFPDDQLKAIGSELQPGTSMIVAEVEQVWVDEVHHELLGLGARTLRPVLDEPVAQQVEARAGTSPGPLNGQDADVGGPLTEEPSAAITSPSTIESSETRVSQQDIPAQ